MTITNGSMPSTSGSANGVVNGSAFQQQQQLNAEMSSIHPPGPPAFHQLHAAAHMKRTGSPALDSLDNQGDGLGTSGSDVSPAADNHPPSRKRRRLERAERQMSAGLRNFHISTDTTEKYLNNKQYEFFMRKPDETMQEIEDRLSDTDSDSEAEMDDYCSSNGETSSKRPNIVLSDEVKQYLKRQKEYKPDPLIRQPSNQMAVVLWQPGSNGDQFIQGIVERANGDRTKDKNHGDEHQSTSSSGGGGGSVLKVEEVFDCSNNSNFSDFDGQRNDTPIPHITFPIEGPLSRPNHVVNGAVNDNETSAMTTLGRKRTLRRTTSTEGMSNDEHTTDSPPILTIVELPDTIDRVSVNSDQMDID